MLDVGVGYCTEEQKAIQEINHYFNEYDNSIVAD